MVIQDETHLAAANVLFEINSKLLKDVPKSYGMTGTIPKEEHLRESIRANFGEVVYTIPASELQEKGILAKCDIQIHQVIYDKMYNEYHDEKKAVNSDKRIIDMISNDVLELTSGDDKSNTLILVENIDTGKLLQQAIPNSIFLSGTDKSKKRKEEYDTISDENDKVLIATYGIASTGISINRLFNLILFNPGKSFTRVIQSVGRGLRVAKDKDYVAIRDYSFSTKYSKRHLTERKKYYKESKYPFTIIKRSI
jgi:superfamily II DNA or RNA helicase